MKEIDKYQPKIIKLCDWPYETKLVNVCDSVFKKPISIYNQPLTKPVSIGWWGPKDIAK